MLLIARAVAAAGGKVSGPDPSRVTAANATALAAIEIQRLEAERIELDHLLARIKSESDLKAYLSDVPLKASPLRFMSDTGRERFLDSLVFTELGLASFNYSDLVGELSASEIYEILALFGMQHEVRQLPDVRIITRADRLIMARPDNMEHEGWPDMLCDSPGTCVVAEYYLCTKNC